MKNDIIKELSEEYGISSEEYINILNEKKLKNEVDLSVESIDLDEEVKNTSSSVKLLTGIPDIDNLVQ